MLCLSFSIIGKTYIYYKDEVLFLLLSKERYIDEL